MIENISIFWAFIAIVILMMLSLVFFRKKKVGNKEEFAKSALDIQLKTSLETIRQSITLFPSKK